MHHFYNFTKVILKDMNIKLSKKSNASKKIDYNMVRRHHGKVVFSAMDQIGLLALATTGGGVVKTSQIFKS